MFARKEFFFDYLVRDFARGQSRREFVGRTAAFGAVAILGWAGAPPPLIRPVASLLGLPDPCNENEQCKPCEVCSPTGGEPGFLGICVSLCATCEVCTENQCMNRCPRCKRCDKYAGNNGECLPDPVIASRCQSCDPDTGETKELCTACEKCDRGACLQNCPGRCETCDNGKCRKCNGPCESCDPAGKCLGCDPRCERCNPTTEACESTCPGGFSCCFGECTTCCGVCGKREEGQCESTLDTCPEYKNLGKTTVCCGKQCADLLTDLENCGTCGNQCRAIGTGPTAETCDDGKCTCSRRSEDVAPGIQALKAGVECRQEGHECCDGECVEIARYQSDPKHCGKCIVDCEQDEKCFQGECVGSKRLGYRIRYSLVTQSELRGISLDYKYEAVVRELRPPDSEGNNFAGRGTYSGFAVQRKANCLNAAPEDFEKISFEGRVEATASIPISRPNSFTRGNSLTFALVPLNPPTGHWYTKSFRGMEEKMKQEGIGQPGLIAPAVGVLKLSGSPMHQRLESELGSNVCDGKVTTITVVDVEKLDPLPDPAGRKARPAPPPR
jgi:hypothetical protein